MPSDPYPTTVTPRQIASCLLRQYGIKLNRLTFLPLSHAGETWVFRADTASSAFFLKLKKTLHLPGVAISQHLHSLGIPVVAPLQSKSAQAWSRLDAHFLLVFPFIEGRAIDFATLSDDDWRRLGAIVRQIHNAPVPLSLQASLAQESFVPSNKELLGRIASALSATTSSSHQIDPTERQLRSLWNAHQALPYTFLSFVLQTGQQSLRSNPGLCLCHGDLQPGNILQSTSGQLLLIDWDYPTWAPRERDLMFIALTYRSRFEAGYGPMKDNEPTAKFLAANWLLQEFFDCAERILFRPSAQEQEKQWALTTAATLLLRMREMLQNVP